MEKSQKRSLIQLLAYVCCPAIYIRQAMSMMKSDYVRLKPHYNYNMYPKGHFTTVSRTSHSLNCPVKLS